MSHTDRSLSPIETCMKHLEPILGDKMALAKENLTKVKECAIRYYVNAGTNGTDPYFLQRVCCMAIQDISNAGNLGLFRFTFPYIDNMLSNKVTHNP